MATTLARGVMLSTLGRRRRAGLGDVTHSNRMTGKWGLGVDRFVDRRYSYSQRGECRQCDNPCHLCS